MRNLVVALSCLLPWVAAAETPTDPAPVPAAEVRWSVGTGIGFGGYWYDLQSGSIPSVMASVERSLPGRSWLVFGLAGDVKREEADVPEGSFGAERDDVQRLFVVAGVRRVLTPDASPVALSVTGLAQVGFESGTLRWRSGSEVQGGEHRGWQTGVSMGLAADRQLTEAIVIRLASELVEASYRSFRQEVREGVPDSNSSSLRLGVRILPRLELRLTF